MKSFTLEPGCIYQGLTGPYREIVKCGRQNVEYRIFHSETTRECSTEKFREWAVADVTEGVQCPVINQRRTS